MKSSEADLRNRGMANQADIDEAASLPPTELLNQLNAPVPAQRTAAAVALRSKDSLGNDETILRLLKRLTNETALYTKIEICNTLATGNARTAQIMCDYLGKIGTNQHTEVPGAVSKKKSYPLPRDIIARSLGKMDPVVAPILFDQLAQTPGNEQLKVSELLDAIGYLMFHHPELAAVESFDHIRSAYKRFLHNELIVWRISLCCSVFPIAYSMELLKEIKQNTCHRAIAQEVERSKNVLFSSLN